VFVPRQLRVSVEVTPQVDEERNVLIPEQSTQ
jgi:hypothetical protein